VSWGLPNYGGDSTDVDFSGGVKSISSRSPNNFPKAFAAIKTDGSVVTWGDLRYGGDSTGVDFSGVVDSISLSGFSIAAIKTDGSVVSWGHSSYGGGFDLSGGVQSITSNDGAFAAIVNISTPSPEPTPTSRWTWPCSCDRTVQTYEECLSNCRNARGKWAWTCDTDFGVPKDIEYQC